MKKNLILILSALVFMACNEVVPKDAVNDVNSKMKLVESNLTTPVFIEGDSTWTIEDRMEHYGVPGVSIAVINDYQIDWIKSYGVTDKEVGTPVTRETLFQAGSISKPVAAYGALKLVEQEKIDLEANVNTYLESWKLSENEFTKEKPVTLKNLLNHSGGLTVHGFLGYSPDLPVPSLIEVLNGTPPANSAHIFVDKTPEKNFRYSGGGYCVMQQMMIDVGDKPFPQLLEELVLGPLEMENSTYDQPLNSVQIEKAATGYLPNGDMTKGKRHTYPEMAAAGLWSTAEDLAKFAVNIQNTLLGKSDSGLSKAMTEKMLTPFVEEFTGLGIFLNKRKEEIYFGHGGWDEGFSSELIAHKDKGYGVVILTNSNHPDFISELIRSVAITYNWEDFFPIYNRVKLDQDEVDKIIGRYLVNGNDILELTQDEERLYGQRLGEDLFEIIRVSDSTYATRMDNELFKFQINPGTKESQLSIVDPGNGKVVNTHTKMTEGLKIPMELLVEGKFEQSLKGYFNLKNINPDDPMVDEEYINRLGYNFLNNEKNKLAQDLFKVNVMLYPKSSNVYDSYAEACLKIGDLDLAVENYKKSISLDPLNSNAKEMIKNILAKNNL